MSLERSAGAALAYGGRVLVIRIRAEAWEIPKGHIEGDEAPEAAALRELREETSLYTETKIGRHLGDLEYAVAHATKRKRVSYYLATSIETPRFGKRPPRTRELRWIDPDDVSRIALVSEDLRPILHAALA